MNTVTTQIDQFFKELETKLVCARQQGRDRCREFFDELELKLEVAGKLEQELNRRLAHRFNVMKFLSRDELGLSRIIVDLLSPIAEHGQGTLFLRLFLNHLQSKHRISPMEFNLNLDRAQTKLEYVTSTQRQIDIIVRIPMGNSEFCLAFENKPYAGDQDSQVKDYLVELRKKFGDKFLLVYLSSCGEGPSEFSLPSADLNEWKKHLITMSYHSEFNDHISDDFRDFRAAISLTDWLTLCREKCQIQRLRWFLKDFELFCQYEFGDQTMTTDIDRQTDHTEISNFQSKAFDDRKSGSRFLAGYPEECV